ncbi:MAG TPA: cytochrome c oxidase assembly protein [Rhizomicrobium sp.]|jgi:putative membrane protein|nr:cytochrome c oxidase assembly protein [Rhizomicrobium sp.]
MAVADPSAKLRARRAWLAYAGLLAAGATLYVLCRFFPADLPFVLPWEFSWPVFLATALAIAWFLRGRAALAPGERPALWRSACFLAGALADYAVLQTHVDYYAQHMFFIHRWAHFVLHHAAPFLIALGGAGASIRAGMPGFLRPVLDWRPLRRAVDVMQHPAVAPALFVGLLYFWLIPALHTRVMLDDTLYDVMNWTMAVNGIFFWSLVLDARPKPPARLSSLMRALMILLIELPQMLLGAILSLSRTDYYPVYEICGRIFPMTALNDQHYGGLIIWLPGTATSFAAMIAVLVVMRINEERAERLASWARDS